MAFDEHRDGALMAIYTEWDSVFNALTAGVMALFGVWVLTLQPRSRTSFFLGMFALIHGLRFVVANIWDRSDLFRYYAEQGISQPWQAYLPDLLMWATSATALFGLAHALLLPEGRSGRLAWRVMVWSVPPLALATLALYTGGLWEVLLPVGWVISWAAHMAQFSFYYAFASIPLIFAWLYHRAVLAGAAGARQALTMSVALVLWPALVGAYGLYSIVSLRDVEWINVGVLALVFLTGLLWLANIHLDPHLGKAARNAAFLVFGLILFGAIDMVYLWDILGYSGSRGPFFGLARLATVIVLTYAILRDQVLGMDVTFRFAISKSTIAAVFITVFFVASEAAQQYFGDRLNDGYLGILAAGALVFAFTPLSRLADRLAEKAVPSAAPLTSGTAAHEEAYRASVRLAMRGTITRREEFELARIAEAHGISPMKALALRDEVEQESA